MPRMGGRPTVPAAPWGPAAERGREWGHQHGSEQLLCPTLLTGLPGTPLYPQPRCSKGLKQLLQHICQDHEPSSQTWGPWLSTPQETAGAAVPCGSAQQTGITTASQPYCPVLQGLLCQDPPRLSLQPQGPNCSPGLGESSPHSASLSTLCGVAWLRTQSIETHFMEKSCPFLAFRLQRLHKPNSDTAAHLPKLPGRQSSTELHPCLQAPQPGGPAGLQVKAASEWATAEEGQRAHPEKPAEKTK